MNMTRLGLALIASLAVTIANAETPAVNFDQGIDASAILAQAKKAAATEKVSVPAGKDIQANYYRRTQPDCVTVTFNPDSAPASPVFHLQSTEYVEECYNTGDPRHGGGRQCYERPGYTYRESAQVTLRDRKELLPWEYDAFRVCLDGPWLDIRALETAYEYKLLRGGSNNGSFVLAPVKKTPMRPDPLGILGELSPALKLTLTDRWASYYAGESVEIKWTLKRHVKGWFDEKISDGTLNAPAGASYAVLLGGKVQAGKSYYVAYSIRRLGKVSKDSWTKELESNKVSYAPASLALNK